MAVGVLRRTTRWLWSSDQCFVRQSHETWPCPACGRHDVHLAADRTRIDGDALVPQIRSK